LGREGIEEKSSKWRGRKERGLGEKKAGELGFRFWYHDLIGEITDCLQGSDEYTHVSRMLLKPMHSSVKKT